MHYNAQHWRVYTRDGDQKRVPLAARAGLEIAGSRLPESARKIVPGAVASGTMQVYSEWDQREHRQIQACWGMMLTRLIPDAALVL
jgi:hypothetical protein